MQCHHNGRGIFCLDSNVNKADCIEMDPRYDKEIVPVKKYINCNCEKAENKDILCDVQEDFEDYEEVVYPNKRLKTILFAFINHETHNLMYTYT